MHLLNMDLENETVHANNINFSYIITLDNAKKKQIVFLSLEANI